MPWPSEYLCNQASQPAIDMAKNSSVWFALAHYSECHGFFRFKLVLLWACRFAVLYPDEGMGITSVRFHAMTRY